MNANPVLLQKKYCRLIEQLADQLNIPLEEALVLFYNSETYQQMSQGISDMHCRNDAYLVEDLVEEIRQNRTQGA